MHKRVLHCLEDASHCSAMRPTGEPPLGGWHGCASVSHLQRKCALGRYGAARLLHVRSHAMQEATSTSGSLELSQAHVKSRVSNQACFSNKQNTFDYLGSHDACGSQNHSTTFDCRVTSMHTQMRVCTQALINVRLRLRTCP